METCSFRRRLRKMTFLKKTNASVPHGWVWRGQTNAGLYRSLVHTHKSTSSSMREIRYRSIWRNDLVRLSVKCWLPPCSLRSYRGEKCFKSHRVVCCVQSSPMLWSNRLVNKAFYLECLLRLVGGTARWLNLANLFVGAVSFWSVCS